MKWRACALRASEKSPPVWQAVRGPEPGRGGRTLLQTREWDEQQTRACAGCFTTRASLLISTVIMGLYRNTSLSAFIMRASTARYECSWIRTVLHSMTTLKNTPDTTTLTNLWATQWEGQLQTSVLLLYEIFKSFCLQMTKSFQSYFSFTTVQTNFHSAET